MRGQALPTRDDARLLARQLEGGDGERLAQAARACQPAPTDPSPPAPRPLHASERAALLGLPAPFRAAFGWAIGRSPGGAAGA